MHYGDPERKHLTFIIMGILFNVWRPRSSNLVKFRCRISLYEVVEKMCPEIWTEIRFLLGSYFPGSNSGIICDMH